MKTRLALLTSAVFLALLALMTMGAITTGPIPTNTERFQFDNRATTTVAAGTDTTLTNATASGAVTIPANYLTAGTVIEVEAFGATIGMALGQTMTNKFKLSGNTIVTGLIDVEGDAVWFWKSTTTIRTTGVSGTFLSGGLFSHENLSTSRYPRGSGSIDTTAAQTIDFTSAIQGFAAESVICSNLVVKITRP